MDELTRRLERLTREGTATAAPPDVSQIQRRAHRRRRRQVSGTFLAAALLVGLVLGPGRSLTRWVDDANPTGPVGTTLPTQRDMTFGDIWMDHEGRPVPPVVLVAQGVFQGKRWEYLAYRTDRGKVCGQWNSPDNVERLSRQAAGSVIEIDGHRFIPGGGCGFTYGTSGFRNGNRTATDFEASLPASYARVRIERDAGEPMVLFPAGRKSLGRGFIAIRLADLRSIQDMIAYDEQGHVVFHGNGHYTSRGLDFTPVRSK